MGSVRHADCAWNLLQMKLPRIIGLKGKIGAGKSTAAKYFGKYGYAIIRFADPLKNMLRELGLSEEQLDGALKEEPATLLSGATPRRAMQELGTAWGRGLHPDFWVNIWRQEVLSYFSRTNATFWPIVIADDCRFPNEAKAIRELGGVVIEIRRDLPGLPMPSCHVSEIQDWPADFCVFNDGLNRDALFARLERALETWLDERPCFDGAA